MYATNITIHANGRTTTTTITPSEKRVGFVTAISTLRLFTGETINIVERDYHSLSNGEIIEDMEDLVNHGIIHPEA